MIAPKKNGYPLFSVNKNVYFDQWKQSTVEMDTQLIYFLFVDTAKHKQECKTQNNKNRQSTCVIENFFRFLKLNKFFNNLLYLIDLIYYKHNNVVTLLLSKT